MMWWKRKEIKVLDPLEGYNLWASTYSEESNPIKNLSDSFIERFLPDLNGKTVLDAGCGTGRLCSFAERQKASKIVGIDLSPAMIEIAKMQSKSTEYRCGSLTDVVIEENYFDVIICSLVLGHIEHLKPTLTHLLKALKKEASLIITDFHPFLTLLQSKRTFKDSISGQSFEVRHHLHFFQQYVQCFNENGVVIEIVEEPLFQGTPVIFCFRVKKI